MLSHCSRWSHLILLQPGFNPITSLHLFSDPQCLRGPAIIITTGINASQCPPQQCLDLSFWYYTPTHVSCASPTLECPLHSDHTSIFLSCYVCKPISPAFLLWLTQTIRTQSPPGFSKSDRIPVSTNSSLWGPVSICLNAAPGTLEGPGIPRWLSGKEPACQCRSYKRLGLDSWVRKKPWRRKWQPIPVFLPGESPRTEEPGGLQSMGSQTAGHDWAQHIQKKRGQPAAQCPAEPDHSPQCFTHSVDWKRKSRSHQRHFLGDKLEAKKSEIICPKPQHKPMHSRIPYKPCLTLLFDFIDNPG